MKSRTFISSYTPSNTDPQILERILVQREQLLKTVVRRLKRSLSSGDKHHFLLSGPRGCGKTHFLTLVHYRLTQDPALEGSMRIAWLGEDAVITSLVDLALEMNSQLALRYPEEFSADIRSQVQSLPSDEAAEAILKEIIKRLGDRNLLLMMENLDRAFQGLGEGGQKKWRAFLQETRKIATLATTQHLFDGVSKRDEAFFGFFDIHHLNPLSFENALQLITNVAREYEKEDLVDFLGTSEGHFRIRALRHLAGGNHRMYIMLSEFLTKDSLDELVSAFEQLAEELTPYFQERLRSLPPQQARIVQSLCNTEGALIVKDVAADTFLPERNCSKLLGELKKKRFVISEKRGKESYYEMAEPIMRLCLEIKNQRGRPLRLIARFLRAWFPEEVLQSPEGHGLLQGSRSESYRTFALDLKPDFYEAIKGEIASEIKAKIKSEEYQDALGLADELKLADLVQGLFVKAYLYSQMKEINNEISCLMELIKNPNTPPDKRAKALCIRAVAFGEQGHFDLALADCATVIKDQGVPADQRIKALVNRAVMHIFQGHYDLALSDCTVVIEDVDVSANQRISALLNRAVIYSRQGYYDLALSDCIAVIENPETPFDLWIKALINRAATHARQGHFDLALADCITVIENPKTSADERVKALVNRATMYSQQGYYDLALGDYTAITKKSNISPIIQQSALFAIPESMIPIKAWSDAMDALIKAFDKVDSSADDYGGAPQRLLEMVLRKGHLEWGTCAADLMEIYTRYGVCDKLCTGLTQSISYLDEGDYSNTQLDAWNEAWQKAGKDNEACEIALKCLEYSVQAIKARSDRPLFNLPLEIRELVLPLLPKTCGKK